jgi:hypothetical protein
MTETKNWLPATSERAQLKSFKSPNEVREFPKGRIELVKVGGATIGRAVFKPGWH